MKSLAAGSARREAFSRSGLSLLAQPISAQA